MNQSPITRSTNHNTQIDRQIPAGISGWLTKIIYPLGQYIVLPGFFREIEIIGKEYIPYTGAVILAPTHRSRWDPILVPYAVGPYVTGRSLRFMVTIDEVQGVKGWLMKRLGGFAIDTNKPSIASIRHSVELLHAGEMLTIFPEGNIIRDGHLAPLKQGLSRIAMQAEVTKPGLDLKVIPIRLHYEQPIPKFRSKVLIEICKPLELKSYLEFSTKTGASKLHQDLVQSLEG